MTSRADDRRPAPEGSSGPRGRFDPLRFRRPDPEDREPRPEVSPEDVAATRAELAELKRRTRRGSARQATARTVAD
jgi:hypothetical protein